MNKKLHLIIPLVLFSTAIYFFLLNKSDKREKYENYIINTALKMKMESGDKKTGKTKEADDPDAAAMQEFFKTVDPQLKRVPVERLTAAYKNTVALEKSLTSKRNFNPVIYWNDLSANMGGRTRMIMFDPNDPNHKKVWAGGVTGGLWYNNDITSASSSWVPIGDFWSNLAISCMTYDPNNTQIMYIGTGEAQTARIIYRKSSGVGTGIFKTEDGGETWELMPSTENFKYITDIIVKNENGTSVIYAGVVSGTYEGQNHQSEPSDGLFRSDDGGNTWTQVLPNIPNSSDTPYSVADIELAANSRIFVGTRENLNLKGGATILYSDSGLPNSWTVYDHYNDVISNDNDWTIPARTIIASAPSDPNVIYAQFAGGKNNGFIYKNNVEQLKKTLLNATGKTTLFLVGIFVGFLSGLLGVGGGNILIPLLILLGFEAKKVAITVSFVVPFSALGSFFTYASYVPLDWVLLAGISIAAISGGYIGNYLMHYKLEQKDIKKIMAFILYLLAFKLLYHFLSA